jgi:ABC-type uncharacterized transport system substrate-binding protein
MADRIEAFRQGLRELGYVEGKNVAVEWRYGEEKPDRVSELAVELVRLKVDVIVSGGNSATQAAKKATKTIPIVMTLASDPVGSGFVASLARPGGNITGLSRLCSWSIPCSRLRDFKQPGQRTRVKIREVERVAGALGVKLHYHDVLTSKDIETAFRAVGNLRPARGHLCGQDPERLQARRAASRAAEKV